MDSIEVTIVNWSSHNPRSTIKHPRWFALSNRILEDPDFFDFSDSEFKAWIYILCQASQKNSSVISINLHHAARVCGLKRDVVNSCLAKLLKAQCIQLRDHDMNTSVHAVITTGQDKTEQNTLSSASADTSVEELVSDWNAKIVQCPKARGIAKHRGDAARRFLKLHSREDWNEILARINASDFLSGRSGKWCATIDWALKASNATKILEDNYGNRAGGRSDNHTKNASEESAIRVLEGIKKFSSHESEKLRAFLGEELFKRACKVPGGIAGIRSAPSGPFTVKNLAGALRDVTL